MLNKIRLPHDIFSRFAESVQNTDPVSGLTHNFYRYPARFSPQFAREAIQTFSQPGDVILDPFMGGGTTLVEALATGRQPIGVDISPLATFVAKAKTTLVGENNLRAIESWAEAVVSETRIGDKTPPSFWAEAGYQKDIPWPIKKTTESILESLSDLPEENQKLFAQCVLLKTAQWAIDCREKTPTAENFRVRFLLNVREASGGMREFRQALKAQSVQTPKRLCLNRSTVGLEDAKEIKRLLTKPKLVITSPPYPGVHVIYHQWQVYSRKRTPAPFWIIGSLDGHGSSHYTFGDYKQQSLTRYFENALNTFSSVRAVVDDKATVVQLVGFADPDKYLPKYLEMMEEAGFEEVALDHNAAGHIKRLWRSVPNRKWYADAKGKVFSSKEVVLVHRPT
ncbi:MAG: site-specific DNA-methyltransferase [Nitrososphaera sp.]|nr:site-specific DNA-methyltransferase [Nitrososphaera sp.]